MNAQSFIAVARIARRALLGRRARSNVTGWEGKITDGEISMYGHKAITNSLRLTTDAGSEWLTLEQPTFLDEGTTGEPPALADGK